MTSESKGMVEELRKHAWRCCRGNGKPLAQHVATRAADLIERLDFASPEPSPAIGSSLELTADFVRALPGGKLDDATYEAIEAALDKRDAPCRLDGRWLTLPERIAALGAEEQVERASSREAKLPLAPSTLAPSGKEGA